MRGAYEVTIHEMQWIAGTFCAIALVLAWQIHRLYRRQDAIATVEVAHAMLWELWLSNVEERLRKLECSQSPEAREAQRSQSSDGAPMGKS